MNELYEKARRWLQYRRWCYVQVFKGEYSTHVLADLARFCRANESTFHTDPRAHAVLEGRREVWLRIQQHLKLAPDQLWEIYTKAATTEED